MKDAGDLGLLGLAQAAGHLAAGDRNCQAALSKETGHLVLVASDAGEATKRRFMNLASEHDVQMIVLASKEMLGRATGRGEIAVLVVTDDGFAKAVLRRLGGVPREKGQG